jgi:hypothetical protein
MELPVMGIGARKARKDLSADALFKRLYAGFNKVPDGRSKDASISMGDALMSAFAMLSIILTSHFFAVCKEF